jgi:uroporphyrinogen-III synthase
VSKWKDLEQRSARTEQQLRLFQRIGQADERARSSLQQVLQAIVKLVQEFTDCDSCLVYLLEGGQLELCASNGATSGAVGAVRLNLDEGLTGWVARERAAAGDFAGGLQRLAVQDVCGVGGGHV